MTEMLQRPPATRLERAVGWVLDPDGVMYGDEQERLRHYEGSTFTASLHAVLVPWALAVCAWVGGRPVAPYLLVVAVVFFVPWVLGGLYVRRRHVRPLPQRISRAFVASAVLTALPYPLLMIGLARALADGAKGGFAHGLVGGLLGGSVAGVAVAVIALVRVRRRAGEE